MISFINLFSDTWSGVNAVVKTFASVKKSVQFVDVTIAEARLAYTGLADRETEDLLNAFITRAVRSNKT